MAIRETGPAPEHYVQDNSFVAHFIPAGTFLTVNREDKTHDFGQCPGRINQFHIFGNILCLWCI